MIKNVEIKIMTKEGAEVPSYAHDGDSGFDLKAIGFKYPDSDLEVKEDIIVEPHQTILAKTGLYMAVPKGYELQVRPRSGNSLKKGYIVANSPGTIDSNYRGEIGVIITNNSNYNIKISIGDKVAQGVLCEVPIATFNVVEDLDDTTRGTGGYGSTGN